MGVITLASLFGETQANIIKATKSYITHPWHDLADSTYTTGSRQAVTGGQEYAFQNNGTSRNKTNFPTHITKLWDTATNKCYFTELMDSPMIAVRMQFNFDPTAAASGHIECKAYIDEPVPKLIQTIRLNYKAEDSRMEALFAFYVGSDTGYDMKTYGLKFTYTPEGNGEVYDRGILIYKT